MPAPATDSQDANIAKPWWKFWGTEEEETSTRSPAEPQKAQVKKLKTVVMPKTVPSSRRPLKPASSEPSNRTDLIPQEDPPQPTRTEVGTQVAVAMTGLATTQDRLNNAISTLSTHLQSSAARDEKVLNSLSSLDDTLNKTGVLVENSAIRSEAVLEKVNETLDLSAEKLETIAAHFDETERDRLRTFQQMQRRSNLIIALLAIALIALAVTGIILLR